MSEMIERVATALAADEGMKWEQMFEPRRQMYRRWAHVAIEAMLGEFRGTIEDLIEHCDFDHVRVRARKKLAAIEESIQGK